MAGLCVDEGDEDVLLMSLTGLVSQNSQEDVVVQGSGLSRGDKRRNAKLGLLRELVPVDNAILGIDLADEKQAVVVLIMTHGCWPQAGEGQGVGFGAGVGLGLPGGPQPWIRRCDGRLRADGTSLAGTQ